MIITRMNEMFLNIIGFADLKLREIVKKLSWTNIYIIA